LKILKTKLQKFDKVDFLVNEDENSIELATSFRLNHKSCNENQFSVINRFTRRKMRWENSKFFVDKFKNFNKCPLVIEDRFMLGISVEMARILNATPIRSRDFKSKEFANQLYATMVQNANGVILLIQQAYTFTFPPASFTLNMRSFSCHSTTAHGLLY
jgi:hypothetical protein